MATLPRGRNVRSSVTTVAFVCSAKAARYASVHTFGPPPDLAPQLSPLLAKICALWKEDHPRTTPGRYRLDAS